MRAFVSVFIFERNLVVVLRFWATFCPAFQFLIGSYAPISSNGLYTVCTLDFRRSLVSALRSSPGRAREEPLGEERGLLSRTDSGWYTSLHCLLLLNYLYFLRSFPSIALRTSATHNFTRNQSARNFRYGGFFFMAGPPHWGKSSFLESEYGDLSFLVIVVGLNWVINFSL